MVETNRSRNLLMQSRRSHRNEKIIVKRNDLRRASNSSRGDSDGGVRVYCEVMNSLHWRGWGAGLTPPSGGRPCTVELSPQVGEDSPRAHEGSGGGQLTEIVVLNSV